MKELNLFAMEWQGMVQFDTVSDKIYINTDRGTVRGSLVLSKNRDGTITLCLRKDKKVEILPIQVNKPTAGQELFFDLLFSDEGRKQQAL